MTKSLNDLLDDYGDACYSNTDEAWAVRKEIMKLFDDRQKQKPIAYYKKIDRVGVFGDVHAFAYYKKDDSYIPLYADETPSRSPIGYLPAYAVRTISSDGAWDSFTLSRERSDPTDIEVYL